MPVPGNLFVMNLLIVILSAAKDLLRPINLLYQILRFAQNDSQEKNWHLYSIFSPPLHFVWEIAT